MNTSITDQRNNVEQIQKRKKMLIFFSTILVIIAGVSTVWWYFDLRDVQSTDDAYVKGNQIGVSSMVAGSVIRINYIDTDLVRKGDTLVTLDDTDANITFKKATNNLIQVVRKINEMFIADDQYNARIQEAKIAYQQSLTDYQRLSRLAGAISREDLQHAKNALDSSKAALDVAVQAFRGNRALIQETALEKQPEVVIAAESMREAWVALQRTRVLSPVTGYVAQRNVQVGETIGSGQALMSIIPTEQVWIDANFKETQLKGVAIGQKVSVVTDFYGRDIVFNGLIDGINMGTGSAFSVLPAQNATGNWIKVVQRLPVRITLDAEQVKAYPLRIGLSATVTLRETSKHGQTLATTQNQTPAFESDALVIDTTPIDNEIRNIIKANAM